MSCLDNLNRSFSFHTQLNILQKTKLQLASLPNTLATNSNFLTLKNISNTTNSKTYCKCGSGKALRHARANRFPNRFAASAAIFPVR